MSRKHREHEHEHEEHQEKRQLDRIADRAPVTPTTGPAPYLLEGSRWIGSETAAMPDTVCASPGRERPRVLVADDNADMREYLARLLGTRWRVEVAEDGEVALESARSDPLPGAGSRSTRRRRQHLHPRRGDDGGPEDECGSPLEGRLEQRGRGGEIRKMTNQSLR
jgi:hypothetical protein